MRSIVLAAFGLAAATGPALTDDARDGAKQRPEFVVDCYDEDRQMVVRELASECHGRVVSEQEGDAIKNLRSEKLGREIRNDGQSAPAGTTAMRKIGTAFFVDPKGKLVTNYHVVAGCKALVVESAAGDPSSPATVEAIDAANDIALLDTTLPAHDVATFERPQPVERDAFVAAIGYPDQGLAPRIPLLTRGVLKSLHTSSELHGDALVVRAEVRPGESGGPILDVYGMVIGMVRAKLDVPLIYSRTGDLPEDDAFGIPSATVLTFLSKNNVPIRIASPGSEKLDPDTILSEANSYVARIDCWE